MPGIGVLIEADQGSIKPACLEAVTAARGDGAFQVTALLIGENPADYRSSLEKYGVEKILAINAPDRRLREKPESAASAIAAAAENLQFYALAGACTPRGRDLLARVSSILDIPLVLDCILVDFAARRIQKSHFSGKTIAVMDPGPGLFACGIRPKVVVGRPAPSRAEVLEIEAPAAGPDRLRIVSVKRSSDTKVELTDATIIISGGKAVGSKENFSLLHSCAEKMGAAVGASRAAVDAGFAPHSMQVGQTGKTVSPALYIACGISGSIQHFAGMKTSGIIIAVNTDPGAPILGKCNYGVIGDLFEIVPALTRALDKEGMQK